MGLHDEAKLDQKFMEFVKLMNVHLNHFPNHEKYGLALEIRRTAYAVYGFIVESQKRYHKRTTLSNLDIEHEKLRMFIRLAHTLGVKRYCRYVDDFVIFGLSRAVLLAFKAQIVAFLSCFRLELSRFTLTKVVRGINFVGFRTWSSKRFIRRHSLYTFRQSLKRGDLGSLASVLGHARRTHSLQHLLRTIKEKHHGLHLQLPKVYRCAGYA